MLANGAIKPCREWIAPRDPLEQNQLAEVLILAVQSLTADSHPPFLHYVGRSPNLVHPVLRGPWVDCCGRGEPLKSEPLLVARI